jgi:predicted ATPase
VLHWADDALLDFVDHLVERAGRVPLLVLGSARPELLSRRPGWSGGNVNSSTLLLSALSEEETATLLHTSSADEQLQRSLALWRSVGAPRYVREAQGLLAAAS